MLVKMIAFLKTLCISIAPKGGDRQVFFIEAYQNAVVVLIYVKFFLFDKMLDNGLTDLPDFNQIGKKVPVGLLF